MSGLKVALLQFDIQLGNPELNERKVHDLLTHSVECGADLVVLPELWSTGYALQDLSILAETSETSLKKLQFFASTQHIWIFAGSILELVDKDLYNTMYIINPEGQIIAKYRKTHLFSPMEEDKYFTSGNEICIIETPFGKIGTAICYDIRFPELIRKTAELGAVMTVVAAEWPHPRLTHWQILNQARAIENQTFVFAVNRVGTTGKTHFCGNSMIINPWGEILAQGGEEEGVIMADIDLTQVESVRSIIPCWRDKTN